MQKRKLFRGTEKRIQKRKLFRGTEKEYKIENCLEALKKNAKKIV